MAGPAYRDLGAAITAVMDEGNVTTVALAEQLRERGWKVDQSLVSKWRNGHKEPSSIRIYPDIDEICRVPRGRTLRRAGYVDDIEPTVEAAIAVDAELTPDYRRQLLTFYRYLRTQSLAESRDLAALRK